MKIEVKIGLIIGSNGKYAALNAYDDGDIDWGIMADSIGEFNEKHDYIYPEAEKRYIILKEFDIPEIENAEIVDVDIKELKN